MLKFAYYLNLKRENIAETVINELELERMVVVSDEIIEIDQIEFDVCIEIV